MDKKDIIRMAREAGFDPHDMTDDFTCNLIDIERFAKLVAAQKEAWSEPQFECPRCGHCCQSEVEYE